MLMHKFHADDEHKY